MARRDKFVRQQMQAPLTAAPGRSRADGGNEERFGIPIKDTGFALLLFFAKKRRFESAFGETLPYLANGQGANARLLANCFVGAIALCLIGVSEQQDTGAGAFSRRMFVRASDYFGFFVLFGRERHVIFFSRHNRYLQAKML